jgi:hypothetical protein
MATPAARLHAYLEQHQKTGDNDWTHVSFGAGPPGVYTIRDDSEFLALYSEAALSGAELGVCERPLPDGMPLIVDLDITVPLEVGAGEPALRLWAPDGECEGGALERIHNVCRELRAAYTMVLNIPEGQLVCFTVLRRERGYLDGRTWKDGIHIQSKDLWAPAWIHRWVRETLHKGMETNGVCLADALWLADGVAVEWDAAPLAAAEPRGPSKKAWFLLGSTKAGTSPYDIASQFWDNTDLDREMRLAVTRADIEDLSLRVRPERVWPVRESPALAAFEQGGEAAGGAAAAGGSAVPSPHKRITLEAAQTLLALLAAERAERDGLAKGEPRGCAQVIQALWNMFQDDGRALAMAFAQRSARHWASERASVSARAWFKGLFKHCAGNHWNLGTLRRMAREDSPAGYETWCASNPEAAAFEGTPAAKLSKEHTQRLLEELTALDTTTGVVRVWDKRGSQVFNHRYLYGQGEHAAAAGLTDLGAFQEGTVVIQSHLGTGKTVLFRALAADPTRTVLYISARRSFTRSMHAEFNKAGMAFRSYLDPRCEEPCGWDSEAKRKVCHDEANHMPWHFSLDEPRCRRLFVQVESLHRFYSPEAARYDLVVLDEVESICAALNPGVTQRANLALNVGGFAALVRGARVVVAGDAFISERSMEMLRALRPAAQIKLLDNQCQPYERVCERIQELAVNNKGEVVERREQGKAKFHARMVAELDKGKRLVVVCGSKTELRSLEEEVFKPRLTASPKEGARPFTYVTYHAETENRDAVLAQLADINETWSSPTVVAYTPTITVGINYDNKAAPFDLMFLYGTRMGATPRDMFQSSLRVRELKENRMVFYLNNAGGGGGVAVGMANIRRRYEQISQLAAANVSAEACQDYLKEQAKRAADKTPFKAGGTARTVHVENMAAVVQQRQELKEPWYFRLLQRNENEAAVSQTLVEEVYAHYLARCGYSVSNEQLGKEELVLAKVDDVRPYAVLADLRSDEAELVRIKMLTRSDSGQLLVAERQAVAKFYLQQRCGLLEVGTPVDPQPPHLPTLEENRRRFALILVLRFVREGRLPERGQLSFCAGGTMRPQFNEFTGSLWSRGCVKSVRAPSMPLILTPPPAWATPENLEALWRDEAHGFARGNFAKFQHLALEKLGKPALAIAERMDIKASSGLAHLSPLTKVKLEVVRTLCAAMGLEHSCAPKTWSHAEWSALVAGLGALEVEEGVTLLQRAASVFGLRMREVEERQNETTPEMAACNVLNRVFTAWCGTDVKRTAAATGPKQITVGSPGGGSRSGSPGGSSGDESPSALAAYHDFATPRRQQLKAEGMGDAEAKKQVGVEWKARKPKKESKRVRVYDYRTIPALDGLLWRAVQPFKRDESEE